MAHRNDSMRVRLGLLLAGIVALSLVLAASAAGGEAHPQIRVGSFPTGIAVNSVTGTVYVGNGTGGTLSVIDGRTCNARNTVGCGQPGNGLELPGRIGRHRRRRVDERTVYVMNASGALAVVNRRRCDLIANKSSAISSRRRSASALFRSSSRSTRRRTRSTSQTASRTRSPCSPTGRAMPSRPPAAALRERRSKPGPRRLPWS